MSLGICVCTDKGHHCKLEEAPSFGVRSFQLGVLGEPRWGMTTLVLFGEAPLKTAGP